MNFSSLHSRRPRLGRGFRLVALFAVLMLAFGAAISATAEHGGLPPASYTADFAAGSPESCEATLNCSLSFIISNASPPNSGSLMDTATVTLPDGFSSPTVVGVTVVALTGKSWTAAVSGATVTLEAAGILDPLGPGESVTVSLETTPSLAALGPNNTVVTTASGTNPLLGATAFHRNQADPTVTVVNDQVVCEKDEGCETATVTLNNTSAKAVASSGPTQEILTLSVGGSFADERSFCLSSSTFIPKGEAVTTNVTGNTRSHTVTLSLDKTIDNSPGAPGAQRFQICVAADGPFPAKGGPAVQNAETGMWEGLLPDCPPVPVTKCVVSRTRSAGKTVITYFVEPGDPISIPGLDGQL